jgi:hypothetical protein
MPGNDHPGILERFGGKKRDLKFNSGHPFIIKDNIFVLFLN